MRQTASMRRLYIDAKDDPGLRLEHRDRLVEAIIELIRNALDAEADNVSVVIERNPLDGVERVRVRDDGHEMAPVARGRPDHRRVSARTDTFAEPVQPVRFSGSADLTARGG
jgi:hypothetical protein